MSHHCNLTSRFVPRDLHTLDMPLLPWTWQIEIEDTQRAG
jgi:hypothetical protein